MVKRTVIRGKSKRGARRRRGASLSQRRRRITSMLNKHLHRRFAAQDEESLILGLTDQVNFHTKELVFQLNKVSQYTELTTMYDQYKINFVEIFMMWSPTLLPIAHTSSGGPENRAGILPPCMKVFHLPDYDDSDPLTQDEFRQRAKTKLIQLKPNQRVKITIKPAVLSQIYETLTSTGYAPKWNVKLDTNDPNVPHYSYKFGILVPQCSGASAAVDLGKISYEIRYNLTMYNTK